MTPEEIVGSMIAALERMDLPAALEFLADDAEYDNVPMGKVFGHAAITAALTPILTRSSGIEWIVHHQAASGDATAGVVMNERTDRFLFGDRWAEIAVAGLFVVRDGRIVAVGAAVRVPEGARVWDATGLFVHAGLVDGSGLIRASGTVPSCGSRSLRRGSGSIVSGATACSEAVVMLWDRKRSCVKWKRRRDRTRSQRDRVLAIQATDIYPMPRPKLLFML